ncbi:glycosyltransferase family 2 protein [Polynucleobacter sp. AP-Nickl1-40-C4]|uniref:glycosyltransferase family 2 protein n=1 Tax=Polynucleobacter sp. AP-Nickl1-40-C4 TaxID=3108275 RepID=UPI002B22A8AB|nr:glycosyltransferase family 2 protein [Polynucleobacter sp. AP-Nickl1-40-C4]MEA9568020.1 glycosyltransferase family 2 protein [Polynucleobacter sp. AP-Nickl1-40-C4]
MEIKHTILVICYNQEKFIRQALDSVLCEQIKPHEIIIGDDFSTDGTRRILKDYKDKYPDIIKLVLNEKNIGIFANLNNIVQWANGDVISFLSGDDWYKPKFLEKMNAVISYQNLDPQVTRFLLMPNTVIHHPSGVEISMRNDARLFRRFTAVGLIFREKFRNQHTGISRALFQKWPAFESDSELIGPWADRVHHILFAQYLDNLVYMDADGPVYRSGVGVSSRTNHLELERSFQKALIRLRLYFKENKLRLNKLDNNYLEFLIAKTGLSLGVNYSSIMIFIHASWVVMRANVADIPYISRETFKVIRRIISKQKNRINN